MPEEERGEAGFIRDENPHVVFQCSQCKQYAYVKTSRKSKKCPRCGRLHQVSSLLSGGLLVKGITAAANKVKELQNQLGDPTFHATQEFTVPSPQTTRIKRTSHDPQEANEDGGLQARFSKLLVDISKKYKQFPLYLIRLMASDHGIPNDQLEGLIQRSIKDKKLIKKRDDLFAVREPA